MYKISFVKKTVLYALFFFVVPLQAAYVQEPINPILLLENTEGHQFYSFENNTLSLYKINKQTEYVKIWEYQFLNNKDSFLEKEWNELYKLSENTFVEETDSLKQSGAGAGLTDND